MTILFFAKGRGYYAGAVYPMLFAAGSILWERAARWLTRGWSLAFKVLSFAAIAAGGLWTGTIVLPILPVNSPHNVFIKINGDLWEEVGWKNLVAAVARIRSTLTPAQRANFAIITGNYGRDGRNRLLRPAYRLPRAMSGTNTAGITARAIRLPRR